MASVEKKRKGALGPRDKQPASDWAAEKFFKRISYSTPKPSGQTEDKKRILTEVSIELDIIQWRV